jgi:hypothetical protein
MNKTISKKVFLRLTAQADEADIYCDHTVATALTGQILKYADNMIRDEAEDKEYEYSKEQLVEDVKQLMWDAATRIFDFYDETPDAKNVEEIIDFETDTFLEYFDNLIKKPVGKFEPKTPGEDFTSEEEDEDKFEFDDNEDDATVLAEIEDDKDEAADEDENKDEVEIEKE